MEEYFQLVVEMYIIVIAILCYCDERECVTLNSLGSEPPSPPSMIEHCQGCSEPEEGSRDEAVGYSSSGEGGGEYDPSFVKQFRARFRAWAPGGR